jgi:hypothetical protein
VHFALLLGLVTTGLYPPSSTAGTAAIECVSDSSAQSTLQFARNLMTAPGPFMSRNRAGYRLPRLRESQVLIVTSKAVCERAADAYAHRFGPGASLDVTPERIVVVQAGDYYFVENLSPGEGGQVHDENFWEIQLFTSGWRPIVSFGQGG